jgi:hypothetical protein
MGLAFKFVLTLRVNLPCRKCKMLNIREIFVLSFIEVTTILCVASVCIKPDLFQ